MGGAIKSALFLAFPTIILDSKRAKKSEKKSATSKTGGGRRSRKHVECCRSAREEKKRKGEKWKKKWKRIGKKEEKKIGTKTRLWRLLGCRSFFFSFEGTRKKICNPLIVTHIENVSCCNLIAISFHFYFHIFSIKFRFGRISMNILAMKAVSWT